MIPLLKPGDAPAHFLHDSAALMAQDGRQRHWNHLMLCHLVGVADAAGRNLHQDLAFCRRFEFHFLELERLPFFPYNCSCYLHIFKPPKSY